MDQLLEKTIYDTVADTLEKLAFLFVLPVDEADSGQPGTMVTARLSFSGSFSGILIMKVSAEALPELTANMLGLQEDEETTPDQQHDALKETLNVICGNLLPAIAGSREVFDIDAPRIVPAAQTIAKNHNCSAVCNVKLALEDGQCELLFFTDGPIA